jgi:LysM repeat protein
MKSTLIFATLSIALAWPSAFAESELETLRSRCSAQERHISRLQGENSRLKGRGAEKSGAIPRAKAISLKSSKTKSRAVTGSGYTVVAGDSLEKIARKLGTSPRKLGGLNGLKADTIIHPGQRLKAPGASDAVAKARIPSPKNLARNQKVRSGSAVANDSGKRKDRSETIAAAEPKKQVTRSGGDQDLATATQTIAVTKAANPEEKASLPIAETPPAFPQPPISTATPETTPATGAETEAPKAEKKIRAITIDGEMTYGEFAAKHGTDAERLNALNGLDLTTATVLAKGSELYVPAEP